MSNELMYEIGLVLLCAPGVVPAAIFYGLHCKDTPRGENRFPLWLYVVALLICAYVAFWGGFALGVNFACRGPSPGNLCGLWGAIVFGPLSSIIAVTVFSWLITYFPRQLKGLVLAGVLLVSLLASGSYVRSFFLGLGMHQSLYQYRLQSGNLDDLHRFAPIIETQMRELPILKDVSLDSQLKSHATVDADRQKVTVRGVKELPTMTILFRLAPKVALGNAIARIHDMEIRLMLPATITTSYGKAK